MADQKPLRWIGTSREDLRQLPLEVRRDIGYALDFAQKGTKHPSAKPLQGFGGAGVLEVVESHAGNAYRAVYTVRFALAIYVLHVFQKKSKAGVKTPQKEIDLIHKLLKRADEDHRRLIQEGTPK